MARSSEAAKRLVIAILSLLTVLFNAYAHGQQRKTGEFQTTFTERSPLTTREELVKAVHPTDAINPSAGPPAGTYAATADYDLSKETFAVYVPEKVDPQTPLGLIVWINYKDSPTTPPSWKAALEKSKLIFAVASGSKQAEWVRAGLALDAVHNLKKLYPIDEKRVYLFSMPQYKHNIGQEIGWSLAEPFTGFVYIYNVRYFRSIPGVPDPSRTYNAEFPRPAAGLLAVSKTRRHVILGESSKPDPLTALVQKAYQQDGFDSMYMEVSLNSDVHYPNLTTPWLEKVLAYLDAPAKPTPTAKAPEATNNASAAPATNPSNPDAQRMLNLAQSYITAKSYANARTRLQEIITKYPNDPAAKEAKQLLDQIKGK